jgi:hypothetical protein
MRGAFLGILAGTALALTAAQPAAAAALIANSQISINGSVITNTPNAADATALDFTSGTTTNGSLPGNLSQFNGGATGSFAGQFCTGTCGSIYDIASLAVGPLSPALSPFFTLTNGVTFSLSNITLIDRSVSGILGFKGTGIFSGNISGSAFDATPGNFVFSTQGGNVTTFSASTTAVPEPAAWALMLLGFAGIGMAMRRRRRPALAQIA